MIPSWAKIGETVICIKRGEWSLIWGSDTEHKPSYGEICRINGVYPYDELWCISLVGYGRHKFNVARFRTLVSKTESEDLAVFRRIADLAGVDEALRALNGENA